MPKAIPAGDCRGAQWAPRNDSWDKERREPGSEFQGPNTQLRQGHALFRLRHVLCPGIRKLGSCVDGPLRASVMSVRRIGPSSPARQPSQHPARYEYRQETGLRACWASRFHARYDIPDKIHDEQEERVSDEGARDCPPACRRRREQVGRNKHSHSQIPCCTKRRRGSLRELRRSLVHIALSLTSVLARSRSEYDRA
jgi:hypothetical protein